MTTADNDPSSTRVPRSPANEATDAIRGFVSGWARTVEAILAADEQDEIYVEVFEDIAVLASSGSTGGIQIKDKKGAFSISREDSCDMLERWVEVFESQPNAWFRFCSTQSAGNLHDRSDAFPRWVRGEHNKTALEVIRDSMLAFLEKYPAKFPRLKRRFLDADKFSEFWQSIQWRLDEPAFFAFRDTILDRILASIPGIDRTEAEFRLNLWIGALATSSASPNVHERRWTKRKLLQFDRNADSRFLIPAIMFAQFAGEQLHRLTGTTDEQGEKLDQILALVQQTQLDLKSVSLAGESQTQKLVQGFRQTHLEHRLRDLSNAAGQRLWEEIRSNIRGLDTAEALDAGPQLEQWFFRDAEHAEAAIRGRAAVLLGDLAIIESAQKSGLETIDVERVRLWLGRAIEAFGNRISEEDAGRLVYLRARLLWFENRRDDALALLLDIDDSNCVSLRLSIELEMHDVENALKTARSLSLDERWADRLAMAFAYGDSTEEAERVISWARDQSSPVCYQRCLVAFAQGSYDRIVQKGNEPKRRSELTDAEKERLRGLLSQLKPLTDSAVAHGRPASGREYEAIEIALSISHALRKGGDVQELGNLLSKANRASLVHARAVCRGDCDLPIELATTLRLQYPDSVSAAILAIIIDHLNDTDFVVLMFQVESVAKRVRDSEDKEQLASVIFEAALYDKHLAHVERAKVVLNEFVGSDHSLFHLAAFELERRRGNNAQAAVELAAAKDESDPVWLQFSSNWEYHHGSRVTALNYQLSAARIIDRAESFWRAFSIASELNDRPAMRELMETVLLINPHDQVARKNLAAMDFNSGRFKAAVDRLMGAWQESSDKDIGLMLGQAQSLAGQMEDSATTFRALSQRFPGELQPLFLLSGVLEAIGKVVDAFDAFHAVRSSFWSDTAFLMRYMDLGYRAKREDAAHLAFARLRELQAEGIEVPMRALTLEELLIFFRDQRARHEQFNSSLLQGRVPWTVVATVLNRETYSDWVIRTQEAQIPDLPLPRADLTIYATNGFAVARKPDGLGQLVNLRCGGRSVTPIVDISALITLHRLRLLERAISFFGSIIVPARLSEQFLDERRSLRSHQPLEHEANRAIVRECDLGHVEVITDAPSNGALPTLDEHYLDSETAEFHLIDAAKWLLRAGRISLEQFDRSVAVCHRPENADANAFEDASRRIRVTISTLTTAYKVGLFERLVTNCRLFVDGDELRQCRLEILAVERREELRAIHEDFHDILFSNPAVRTMQPQEEPSDDVEEAIDRHPSFDAILLAEKLGLPLLADDRVLQTIVLNANNGNEGSSFGTDQLLSELLEAGSISLEERANAYLQLIRWRYRFLIPSADVLVHVAAKTLDPLAGPGQELREVAQYLHDCFRDPGLFNGPEATTPPTPLGLHYFVAVVEEIGEFILRIWHDDRFDEAKLSMLVNWCVSELVPTPPTNLPYTAQVIIADNINGWLLTSTSDQSLRHADIERSRKALQTLRRQLGIRREDYEEIIHDLIRLYVERTTASDGNTDYGRAAKRLAITALPAQGTGLKTQRLLLKLGLSELIEGGITAAEIAAVNDPAHPRRILFGAGPWVMLRAVQGNNHQALFVPELLYHPHSAIRQTSLVFLKDLVAKHGGELSARLHLALEQYSDAIVDTDADSTVAAGDVLADALSCDFCLTLMSFRQTNAARMDSEIAVILQRILEPSARLCGSVQRELFQPPAQRSDVRVATDGDLRLQLDSYYQRYGHVPLSSPFAIDIVLEGLSVDYGNAWEQVIEWANDKTRPLKRYHAARLFLRYFSSAGLRQREVGWNYVHCVLAKYAGESFDGTLDGEAWRFLVRLAKHYQAVLEVCSHDADQGVLTSQAWWMAERATQAIVEALLIRTDEAGAAEALKLLIDEGVRPLLQRSSIYSLFARPARKMLLASYGTHIADLWGYSLLEVSSTPQHDIPSSTESTIEATLFRGLVLTFPSIQARKSEDVWAIAKSFVEIVSRWGAIPIEGNDSVDGAASPPSELEYDNTILDELDSAFDLDGGEQGALLRRFHVAIRLGRVSEADIGKLFADQSWTDRAFDMLPIDSLMVIAECILEIMRIVDDEWKGKLVNYLVSQTGRTELSEERQTVAATQVVFSCLVTGRIRPISTIGRSENPAVIAALSQTRELLVAMRSNAPELVKARIRAILAYLPWRKPRSFSE